VIHLPEFESITSSSIDPSYFNFLNIDNPGNRISPYPCINQYFDSSINQCITTTNYQIDLPYKVTMIKQRFFSDLIENGTSVSFQNSIEACNQIKDTNPELYLICIQSVKTSAYGNLQNKRDYFNVQNSNILKRCFF
jgi:hypothetical protein